MTCWSAAATMILGSNQSIGPGEGSLGSSGGLMPKTVPAFAASHGLTVHYPQSWTAVGLAELLEHGPLWVAGRLPSSHAVVISAIEGDGSPENTKLTVYDPWPPGQGRIIRDIPYGKLMQTFPMATMYILHQ